ANTTFEGALAGRSEHRDRRTHSVSDCPRALVGAIQHFARRQAVRCGWRRTGQRCHPHAAARTPPTPPPPPASPHPPPATPPRPSPRLTTTTLRFRSTRTTRPCLSYFGTQTVSPGCNLLRHSLRAAASRCCCSNAATFCVYSSRCF